MRLTQTCAPLKFHMKSEHDVFGKKMKKVFPSIDMPTLGIHIKFNEERDISFLFGQLSVPAAPDMEG